MIRVLRAKGVLVVLLIASVAGLSGCIAPEAFEPGHSHKEARATAAAHPAGGGSSAAADCDEEDRPDPAAAYPDADIRYSNVVDGREDSERTVHVPLDPWHPVSRLRVALIHDSNGDVTFHLEKPLFLGSAAEESVSGEKFMDEPEWFVMDRPYPGDWSLTIEVSGNSSYTLGFYFE